jgi:MFS superfamily sulfate permease-like transporter
MARPGLSLLKSLRYDIPSSLVVFFVALPLCLGIALASNAPLYAGLISGIIGGLLVGAFSNSSIGVSGPAAGLVVVIYMAIQRLGSFEEFLVAVVLAGLLQIILGVAGAGIVRYYFPTSVIKGMLSAIGIIIILKQLPHTVGYDADYVGDLSFRQADGYNTFSELSHMLGYITPAAVVVSVISMSILLLWELYLHKKHYIFRLIQGPVVAVAAGIAYELITNKYFPDWSLNADHLVSVPVAGSVQGFLNNLVFPDWSALSNPDLWVVAATLVIIASLETLLSVEATDRLDPFGRKTDSNRELIAQGIGNFVAGLIGGLPVTQVILRSSANVQSGARTKMSTLFHGAWLAICVLFFPHILNLIPLAVLAAILIVIGFKLSRPGLFRQMYRLGYTQFLPFTATILGVVFTDLLKGIGIGLVVAVMMILRNSYRNSHAVHKESDDGKHIRIYLSEELTFLNKPAIAKELEKIQDGSHVIIDKSRSLFVDYDVMEILNRFVAEAPARNIKLEIYDPSLPEDKLNVFKTENEARIDDVLHK